MENKFPFGTGLGMAPATKGSRPGKLIIDFLRWRLNNVLDGEHGVGAAFAKSSGFNQSWLSGWRTDTRSGHWDTITQLIEAFGYQNLAEVEAAATEWDNAGRPDKDGNPTGPPKLPAPEKPAPVLERMPNLAAAIHAARAQRVPAYVLE